MKINKAELQTALEKVRPGLANRELIEQATSFAFMAGRVVTYNDEISISHPLMDSLSGSDMQGAIKADALYEFLNRVNKEEIDLSWEGNQLQITAGRAKAGLLFEAEVCLPVQEVGEIGDWHDLPQGFVDGVNFCRPCCSRDMSRPIFTCLNVDGKLITATDAYQIIRYEMPGEFPVPAVLIPATAVQELTKYDIQQVATGQNWLHFRTEDETVFSCRVFEGEFPDVTQHFQITNGTEIQFPSKTTMEALERAQVFAQQPSNSGDLAIVSLNLQEKELVLQARGTSGWFQETVRTKYAGTPIEFSIGIDFLLDLLNRIPACIYDGNKILFQGENWKHVVATCPAEGAAK